MSLQDPEQLYFMAEQMAAEGRYNVAELMLRQAMELDGDKSDLYAAGLATLIGLQEGRTEESLKIIETQLKTRPDNPNLLVAYGLTVKAAGHADEAEASLRQALEKRADHPLALHSLATVLGEKGQAAEAERLACKAFTLVPDHAEFALTAIEMLEASGKLDTAYEVASLGATLNPQEMDLVQKAVEGALARREPDRAWEVLKESDEELPWVLGWKATLLDHQGKVDEANELLKKGRERFSEDLSYLVLEAAIWMRRNQPEEAYPVMEKILALDPTNRAALRMRADYNMDNNSPEEAVTDLESVYDEDPDDPQVALDLITGYYKCRRYRDARELCDFWEEKLRKEPLLYVPPQIRVYSSLVVAALGDAKEALWRSDWIGDEFLLDAINELKTYGNAELAEEKLLNRLLERLPEPENVNPFDEETPPEPAAEPEAAPAQAPAPVPAQEAAPPKPASTGQGPLTRPAPGMGPQDSYGGADEEWVWVEVDDDEEIDEDDDDEWVWVEVDDDEDDEDAEYEWVDR